MSLKCGRIAAVDGEDVVESAVFGVPPLVVEALHLGALGGVLGGDGLDIGLWLLRVG